jgi:hypothetical protein
MRKDFLDPNAVENHCAPLFRGSVLVSSCSAQATAADFIDAQSHNSIRNAGGWESALLMREAAGSMARHEENASGIPKCAGAAFAHSYTRAARCDG